MQRNVYLEGELAEKFGSHCYINAPTVGDALKLIDVNNTGFRQYLIDCHEKGIGFAIDVAQQNIEYGEELLLPLHEGDITITPIPEGGGGGFKKILAAVVIIAAAYFMPVIGIKAAGGFTAALSGSAGFGAFMVAATTSMVATSLMMSGLTEMMAPDPSVDADQEQSYLFNGMEQNVISGDPVPVLYGRLRVPGQPVNFEVKNATANRGVASKTYDDYGIAQSFVQIPYGLF
tara:strand:+ start:346 stop:1041 length:696 start_codon:yes stop_codon:yes gene_type:complete